MAILILGIGDLGVLCPLILIHTSRRVAFIGFGFFMVHIDFLND